MDSDFGGIDNRLIDWWLNTLYSFSNELTEPKPLETKCCAIAPLCTCDINQLFRGDGHDKECPEKCDLVNGNKSP